MEYTHLEMIKALTDQYPPTNEILLVSWLNTIIQEQRTKVTKSSTIIKNLIIDWLYKLNNSGMNSFDLFEKATKYLKEIQS